MTPVLQMLVDAAKDGRVTIQPELAEIGFKVDEFLTVAASAAIYRMDEAEFDTTEARRRRPEHFASFAQFRLPAPLTWIEFKSYGPSGKWDGRRAAYLGFAMPSGAVRVLMVGQGHDGSVSVAHLFDVPAHVVGNREVKLGQEVRLAVSYPHADPRMSTVSNFFFELVELLNLPNALAVRERRTTDLNGRPWSLTVREVTLAELGAA